MPEGNAHKFGDDINTDIILPGEFLSISDAHELGRHCMAGADPSFVDKVSPGDFIVAGHNFGSGSSREHAVIAIKNCGLAGVIAKSFARIFYRNAFNMGLPILAAPEAVEGINDGDRIAVDLATGNISNLSTGAGYCAEPIPEFMRQMIEQGGLLASLQKQLI